MVYDSLGHFENGYWYIFPFICCHKLSTFVLSFYCTVFSLIHAWGVQCMWLRVVDIQYEDAYVLIDAIQSSVWEF